MVQDNTASSVSEILERKSRAAKQQAYDDELARLEKEVQFRSKELLDQWLVKEKEEQQEELKKSDADRAIQERSLKNRELEFFRQIEEEERRKADEHTRRKLDEERRKKEEEERNRKQEEDRLAAIKRYQEVGHLTPKQIEKLRKAQKILTNVETLLSQNVFEDALVEVSKALSLVPTMPEAIEMREKIRQRIREVKETEEQKQPADEAPEEVESISASGKSSSMVKIVVAIVLVAVISVAIVLLRRQKAVVQERIPIAVMPWSVQPGSENSAYIAYTLPYRLSGILQTVPSLRVMGYPSSNALSQYSKDANRQVAMLGFNDLLLGSLKNEGGTVIIKLQLIDSTGTELWTKSYVSDTTAVDNHKGEMLNQLLSGMNIKPEGRSAALIDKKESVNPEALSSYFHGLMLLRSGAESDAQKALALFQESSNEDQNFADPLVASASILLSTVEESGDQDSMLAHAEALVQKALYINASYPNALLARARIRAIKREYNAALKEIDDALQIENDMSDAYLQRGRIYIEAGNYDEASAALKQALAIDPRNPEILRTMGYVQQLMGQYHQSFMYHDLALQFGGDSLKFLTGPVADCMLFDPDLTANYANRLTRALGNRIERNPSDYDAMYRLGRLEQINGVNNVWMRVLNDLNAKIRKELSRVGQGDPLMNVELALTLTRLGNYTEAARYARLATEKEHSDPRVFYKAAQMYAIQMFSYKKDEIDSTKRKLALEMLQKAVAMDFRIDEILNGDFFNFHDEADFKQSIQIPIK
ncbi:MAG: tetratricopeptide repeat protein [Bacteroidota bacterium]